MELLKIESGESISICSRCNRQPIQDEKLIWFPFVAAVVLRLTSSGRKVITALKVKNKEQVNKGWQLYPLFFLAAICIYFLFLTALNKYFNKDEIEHIHSAWYIVQGFVPFRDFFQHHNPLFWYLLAPVLAITGDQPGLLIFFRMVMFISALGIAAAAAWIAVKLTSRLEAGLYCFILLLSLVMFGEKAIEIRPDVPMTLFCTISAYFFIRYFDSKKARDIILSGIFAAAAFLFLQKAVFLYAALSLFIIVMAMKKQLGIKTILVFFLCLFTGLALNFLYAASQGALYDYYLCSYLLNVSKLYSFSPWLILKESFKMNTGFWVLAVIGFLYGTYRYKEDTKFFCLSVLSILLFLPVLLYIKTPWEQYYMPAVVFFSIIGAGVLTRLLEKTRWGNLVGFLIITAIVFKPMIVYSSYKNEYNRPQLELIEYVVNNTKTDDLVYDGDAQFNLFRKDLHYFWFSTKRNHNIDAYNRITNNKYGDYDICSLIFQKRPQIISAFRINKRKCQVFRMYRRVNMFRVYTLTDKP